MPTNLPAEYYNAEEKFRAAQTREEKIARLEEMLSTIPKHKGTDKLRADLRRKLSGMKEDTSKGGGAVRQVSPYQIDREGAGQVVLIGPPNVGKSALINALTNAAPEVAVYPFTTRIPMPGMMVYENVQIQLIDTPPLHEDFDEGQMMDLVRRVDLVLLVIDLQDFPIEQIELSLDLLDEHRIVPRHLHDPGAAGRPFVKPMLIVVNKADTEAEDGDYAVLCELLEVEHPMIPVSAESGRGLEQLRAAVFDALEIMRVYSKPPGRKPDLSSPFVLPRDSTLEDFAEKVHRDFVENLKSARIWGNGVYDGQMVGRDHVLHDGDVVELRT